MGGTVRKLVSTGLVAPLSSAAGVVAVAALLAGCSSDVSRFNAPVFGLTQSQPTPSQPVYDGAAPAQAEGYGPAAAPPPDYNNGNYGDNSHPAANYVYRGQAPSAPYASAAPVSGAPSFGTIPGQPESYHPERLASNGQTAYIINPAQSRAAASAYSPPALRAPVAPPQMGSARLSRPAPGALVEVMPGETLYMFSRRNGVSISAVMQANNLRSPNVQPGMKLIIPGKGGRSILPPTASLAPVAPAVQTADVSVPAANTTVAASAFAPSNFGEAPVASSPGDGADGTYTVQAGDSVYGIARKHNMMSCGFMLCLRAMP